jgi:hypothetical protein
MGSGGHVPDRVPAHRERDVLVEPAKQHRLMRGAAQAVQPAAAPAACARRRRRAATAGAALRWQGVQVVAFANA